MKKLTAVKIALGSAIAAAAAGGLTFFMISPERPREDKRGIFAGRNYAHRGLFTRDQVIPENSIKAFKRAVNAGYGIELDVQLSKDGQVVVFHDDDLERVCGVLTRVDEYDYEELENMQLFDTDEKIPLFTDVLAEVRGKVPLIVELKTSPRRTELCEKAWEILRQYEGDYCIESFDPRIVAWFRKNAPEVVRGQLATQCDLFKNENDMSIFEAFALSRCLLNFLSRPNFIAYHIGKRPFLIKLMRSMGAMLFAWTPHDESDERKNDSVIFEFYEPEIRYR